MMVPHSEVRCPQWLVLPVGSGYLGSILPTVGFGPIDIAIISIMLPTYCSTLNTRR